LPVRIAGRGELLIFKSVTDSYFTHDRQMRQIKFEADDTLWNFVELKLAKVVGPRRSDRLFVQQQLQTGGA
jgi:hypothetical protein